MIMMMMLMKTLFNECETVTACASNIIIKLVTRTIQNAAQDRLLSPDIVQFRSACLRTEIFLRELTL